MTEDVYGRLTEAQSAYDLAVSRRNRLAGESNRAEAEAREAGSLAERLLQAAASGDESVTDDALMSARDSAAKVTASAELARAKYTHASKQVEQPHLDLLHAKAAVTQFEYDGAIEKLIDSAAAVDDALEAVQKALTDFAEQGKVAFATYQHAVAFSNEVRAAGNNELLAKARQLGTTPAVHVPSRFGLPAPQIELYQDLDRSSINARRVAIPSLAQMIRAAFNRLLRAA
jgi:hypothetical protein